MLQTFIYLNLFLAGAALAIALRYGYEHFVSKRDPYVVNGSRKEPGNHTEDLSDMARSHLMHEAEATFKGILENAAGELQDDLKSTADGVTYRLKDLGGEIVELELKRYKESLENIRNTSETSIGLAIAEVTKHQDELKVLLTRRQKELEATLGLDMLAEKQRLTAELNKKLSGAVTAFLVETLGHNVDLGAQSTYLTQTLEAHKAELLKEIADES